MSDAGLGGAGETQGDRSLLHGAKAVRDVFLQGKLEQVGAAAHIRAADCASEPLVFHLPDHTLAFHVVDGPGGLDEGTGGEEAGKLVTGEERLIEVRGGWDAGVVGVGEDGVQDLFRPAIFPQVGDPDEGMLGGGGVALVVEVMQKAGAGVHIRHGCGLPRGEAKPSGLAGAVAFSAEGDAECVLAQAVSEGPLMQKLEGLLAGVGGQGLRHGIEDKGFPGSGRGRMRGREWMASKETEAAGVVVRNFK